MSRHILLGLALTVGAASPAWADGETIAVMTKNQTNPFFQAERIGTETAARQLNARVLQFIPTQPDSIPEQMSQFDDIAVRKPNAVVFVPVDYKAMVPGVEKLNAAGIPAVNATDRTAGGKVIAFVGANDYDLAKETGRTLLRALGGKGDVIIIEGVRGSLTAVDRLRGFQDALKEFPQARLVASQPGNYQRLQALQVMENLLQSNPQVAGVMAANDAMAAGVIDALADAGKHALVVGINGTKEAIDAIKAGTMLATGDYNGFLQGCIATTVAVRHLRNLPIRGDVVLKPVVIDKSNYQPFDTPVEKRSCPNWDDVPQ